MLSESQGRVAEEVIDREKLREEAAL